MRKSVNVVNACKNIVYMHIRTLESAYGLPTCRLPVNPAYVILELLKYSPIHVDPSEDTQGVGMSGARGRGTSLRRQPS